MNRLFTFALLASTLTLQLSARDARAEIEAMPERAAGVYFAYPTDCIDANAETPKGYEPFYASHYGRHGSR